ncbi:hypothetical protein ACFL3D_04775 [Candidatus Omnitrophota bacterium]
MNTSTTLNLEELLIEKISEIVGSDLSSHIVQACEEYQECDQ